MLDPMKNKIIDTDGVREKFGVGPERVVDVQALAGDSVPELGGSTRYARCHPEGFVS